MGRPASGREVLDSAKKLLRKAHTAEDDPMVFDHTTR